jgi:hypothetical protein
MGNKCVIFQELIDGRREGTGYLILELPATTADSYVPPSEERDDGRTLTYERIEATLQIDQEGLWIIRDRRCYLMCEDPHQTGELRQLIIHPCTGTNDDGSPCTRLLQRPGKRCFQHKYLTLQVKHDGARRTRLPDEVHRWFVNDGR